MKNAKLGNWSLLEIKAVPVTSWYLKLNGATLSKTVIPSALIVKLSIYSM